MMRKRCQRSLALLAVVALAGATACKKTQTEGGTPADSTMAPAAPSDTTMTSAAPAAEMQVTVTNAMPHPMTVKADWGEGENELGSVGPNETKSFDVTAPVGAVVALVATDAEASHSTSGSVTLDPAAPATWTIQ